jgi:drug/metabolite transporter (DMT)-like permease
VTADGLELGVAVIVLLSAALHAAWHALVKVRGDQIVGMTVVVNAGALVGLCALPWVPLPQPAAWPFLAAALPAHLAFFLALAYAYRVGDFSQAYPIARGVNPLLVALGAFVVAGERLSPIGLAGMGLVAVGVGALAVSPGRRVDWRGVLAALLSAVTIAAAVVVDGLGVRRAGSPVSYLAWIFFLDCVPISLFSLWRYGARGLRERAGPLLRVGVLGGVLNTTAYGIVVWAMSRAPMSLVIALRETNVVFGAAIGAVLLREALGGWRLAAAVVVAAGVVLIKLGS